MICPLPFQRRVALWVTSCFGGSVANDRSELACRFLEEAIELFQAAGATREDAIQLVDYVFGRPIGEISQEVGGVALTLAALCEASDIDLDRCAETELASVWQRMETIRQKQASKPHNSPLPGGAK